MSSDQIKCNVKRTGFGSFETWGIVAMIFIAGVVAGYPIGQYFLNADAQEQVDEIREAYREASDAKNALILKCIGTANDAANTAKSAAQAVEQAVEASKQ
ncbi:hypothetical protein G3A39_41830 [Paraburkholderia aspalathi]|nr:hypothetical protein [Paraburkholderia aspalathi]